MPFADHCRLATTVVLFLLLSRPSLGLDTATITSSATSKPTGHASSGPAPTCEFRTINYITDSLPQQCPKSSWSNTKNITSRTAIVAGNDTAIDHPTSVVIALTSVLGVEFDSTASDASVYSHTVTSQLPNSASSDSVSGTDAAKTVQQDVEIKAFKEAEGEGEGELNDATFLSFEEWKKQTLEKAGQQGSNIGNKKPNTGKKRDSENLQTNFDSIGEEGEIELDFGPFKAKDEAHKPQEEVLTREEKELDIEQEHTRRKDQHRSKDAGKTCKERFSYASFDAGATVLKTHPGAKNAKSVLIENKDSYMLSECAAANKFLIIELSEDIWIDTLVLANYEFFSSMIKTFRVSVTDRYPVKHWHDLGVLEARNSREIQAFLIENPMIWARYIRLEFLTHYGNEYYCPLSLVRVHGTRMIENWKQEERGEEDDDDDEETQADLATNEVIQDSVGEIVSDGPASSVSVEGNNSNLNDIEIATGAKVPQDYRPTTPWLHRGMNLSSLLYFKEDEICLPEEKPEELFSQFSSTLTTEPVSRHLSITKEASEARHTTSHTFSDVASSEQPPHYDKATTQSPETSTKSTGQEVGHSQSVSTSITSAKTENGTMSQKHKSSITSSASAALPTIQESFFKAVSRRLQLLETNSTLSLKYIEEQSKMLREAFLKIDKKQAQKTTNFLENLNNTVLAELHGFRQQYDEIWQATIFSLESQRAESQREVLAVSTRLNILADELVFQKRMSIVQAFLLLLCLGLVIFSRVSSSGNLDFPGMQYGSRFFLRSPISSPINSPEYRRVESLRNERSWSQRHRRHRSDDSMASRSPSGDDSPPTPVSNYSRSETGPYHQEDCGDGVPTSSQYDQRLLRKNSTAEDYWEDDPLSPVETCVSSNTSPVRRYSHLLSPVDTPRESSSHEDQDIRFLGITERRSTPSRLAWSNRQNDTDQGFSPAPPSPQPEQQRKEFSIARKPLPALPDEL